MTKNIKAPKWTNIVQEVFSGFSWAATAAAWPLLSRIEQGDGHPVLVLPGLLTNDLATLPLREFLEDRGHPTYPWEQGINRGPLPDVMKNLVEKIDELYDTHGEPFSLVGWSMGGAISVALTQLRPKKIRNVITLGSPLAHAPHATNAKFFFELVSGMDAECVSLAKMIKPHKDVPITSLFTKNDGIVGWETSANFEHPKAEAIEILGTSHLGIVAHPGSFYLIANRLRQNKKEWTPYQPKEAWENTLFDPHEAPTFEVDKLKSNNLKKTNPTETFKERREKQATKKTKITPKKKTP